MVETGAGDKKFVCQVDQIKILDMQVQMFGYFGLQGIGNLNQFLPKPLVVSDLQTLANNQQEIQNVYNRVCSDMISKKN